MGKACSVTGPGRSGLGKVCRAAAGAKHSRLCSDHSRIGPAVSVPLQALFCQFEVAGFEEVSYKSFVFTSSTVTFLGGSLA